MDTQTRHALKQDRRIETAANTLGWLELHRKHVLAITVGAVALLLAIIGGVALYVQRSAQAQVAFGQAVEVYTTPLAQPGAPADPNQQTYTTNADRAKAANALFTAISSRYSLLAPGRNARYFAGLSYIDMGQNGQAETALKDVAGSHDSNLSSLASTALAGLYHRTGRDADAIKIYQDLIAHPTDTVPASAAKLQLAELYEATNPSEARKLYAEIEDKDKATAAGQIAAQKLKGPGK